MNKSFLHKTALNLFPADYTCDICGVETFGTNICPDCLKTLTFNNGNACPVCGRKTLRAEICLECKYCLPHYKRAISPLVYENGAVILLHKFKSGDGGYLKEYFADLINEKLKILPTVDCIIYVPMTKKAVKRRGYNQCELLADAIAERTGISVLKDAIEKSKDTPEQKGLSRKERAENLSESFKVVNRAAIKGKTVLLVDDVMTTGATVDEICKKLLSAKAAAVYVATVCSVEYKTDKK